MLMAVIFPEGAALAKVLAAPAWQALAASGTRADDDRLLDAVNNALGCTRPPDRHDISDTVMVHLCKPRRNSATAAGGRLP